MDPQQNWSVFSLFVSLQMQTLLVAWVSEGGGRGIFPPLDFEIFSKKRLFIQF